MLPCPVCDTPNAEDSQTCEHCNCALKADSPESFLPDNQQTVAATLAFSASARSASAGAAVAHAFSSELTAGTVLVGRYEIVALIGQGGMGTVYKATDHELDRIIALKTIRPDLAANDASLRRLRQETLLARQIAHRNVIRVYDLGVSGALRFITMEFVEGQDLKSVLELRKKLTPEEAAPILHQICQGLSAAHSENVVHRDLKPQNILLSPDGRVRIMDFGLARSFDDTGMTQTGGILGTPAYMSPEQALGQHGDIRSDIFSFGVIAYELLTGQLPFPSQTLSESLVSRTRGRARPIEVADPSTPPWLACIIMKCLERQPADRYSTTGEIMADLLARDNSAAAFRTLSGPLAPGTMVGSRYRIEAEAGEGGMGKVYRATDLDLHRTVALKVVRPELSSSPHTLEQLMQEISVASQISHKNVLRIHDLGEASGLRFVSMAWAEGEDLSQLLHRTGPLPEDRILELACEICEGLQAAHEQGISHQDLKPSNILVTSTGHACIADFGLARSSNGAVAALGAAPERTSGELSSSSAPSVSGTPRYMSPEQVDGGDVDHRTDIYSLGIVLYEMATGRIPFKDDSVFQTLSQRISETAPNPKLLNPSLSDELAGIILHCLERKPQDRYASVRDLLDALHHVTDKPEARPGESTPVGTNTARHLGIAAAALLIAGVAGWPWYRHFRPAGEAPVNGKYIAVIPFRAVGSDPSLKYRAEGIADAVSARLASLDSLHPVSNSAIDQANLAQPDEKIGQQLGANLLVKGNVQSEGDRIKVNASILNVEKHKTLWSKSYEGVAADLFTLEDEISNDTVHALNVNPTLKELERAAPAPTQNLAAYDLYYKGRDILKNHRDAPNAKAALDLFEQARNQDNSFALAWTGVADANLLLYRLTKDSLYSSKAVAAAQEARNRNNNLPEVHLALGSVYTATGRNAEAIDEIKHALQLEPNSDNGYIRLGRAYLAAGRTQDSISALKKAVQLNPYYWYNHKQLGYAYSQLGQNDEALKEFKQQVQYNPTDASGQNNIGGMYFQQGRWKDSIAAFQKAIGIHPSFDEYSNLATAYYLLGRYSEAVPMFEKAVDANPKSAVAVRNLAESYLRTGQKQKAETLFDRAIALSYEQLEVNPQDASTLGNLALCYAAKGQLSQANTFISRARAIDPADSELMYDSAIVQTGNRRYMEALHALRNALQKGYSFEFCMSDPDLKALRESPGFAALKKEFGRR